MRVFALGTKWSKGKEETLEAVAPQQLRIQGLSVYSTKKLSKPTLTIQGEPVKLTKDVYCGVTTWRTKKGTTALEGNTVKVILKCEPQALVTGGLYVSF